MNDPHTDHMADQAAEMADQAWMEPEPECTGYFIASPAYGPGIPSTPMLVHGGSPPCPVHEADDATADDAADVIVPDPDLPGGLRNQDGDVVWPESGPLLAESNVHRSIDLIDSIAAWYGTEPQTLAERARLLAALDGLQASLGDLRVAVNDDIAAAMDADQVRTGELWLQRNGRESNTWRDEDARDAMIDDVLDALVQRNATHPTTGEVDQPAKRMVQRLFDELMSAFPVELGKPKAFARRSLGIDASKYRKVDPAGNGYRVIVARQVDPS